MYRPIYTFRGNFAVRYGADPADVERRRSGAGAQAQAEAAEEIREAEGARETSQKHVEKPWGQAALEPQAECGVSDDVLGVATYPLFFRRIAASGFRLSGVARIMGNRERGNQALETGELGEAKVRPIFLAWGWIPRKDNPDRGIDFNVDVPAGSGRPQERFLVQVKTSKDRKATPDGSWSIRVGGDTLARYEQSRHPVFLVGVNLKNNECRWLDLTLQLKLATGNGIRRGRSFRLPQEHRFDELTRGGLDEAVVAAFRRHDDQFHPPAEALKYRAEQLQAKDPRFQVTASLVGGETVYEIFAREPVSVNFKLVLEQPEDKEALADSIKYGLPAKVNPTSAEMTGSALFQDQQARTIALSQTPQRMRLILGWMASDDSASFVCALEGDAEATRGISGGAVRFTDPLIPFQASIRFDAQTMRASFTFNISTTQWVGQDVRELSYFKGVHQLLRNAIECRNLAFAGRHLGEPSPATRFPLDEEVLETLISACRWFNTIDCLMVICRWAHEPLTWEECDFEEGELDILIRMSKLIRGETLDVDVEHVAFTWNSEVNESAIPLGTFAEFQMHTQQSVTAWGKDLAQVPIIVSLRGYSLDRDNAGVPCGLRAQPGCSATMTFNDSGLQ